MSEDPERSRLDGRTLAAFRLQAGLSRRRLAAAAGVGAGVIRRLEEGGSDRQLSLYRLRLIAERLGVDAADLLTTGPTGQRRPASDDLKLEALLAHSRRHLTTDELARALDWDLLRTRRALRALHDRLNAGVTLKRTAAGWRLAPVQHLLTARDRSRLENVHLARRGLTVRQLRLLERLRSEELSSDWERRASNADRVDLAVLLRAEIVERTTDGRIRLTAAVLYSLEMTPGRRETQEAA